MGNKSHTVAQRIQALALLEESIPLKRIEEVTELSRTTIFYRKKILVEKLLPWAQELQKERPKTIVQEDKAASHAHKHQATDFSQFNIE